MLAAFVAWAVVVFLSLGDKPLLKRIVASLIFGAFAAVSFPVSLCALAFGLVAGVLGWALELEL
jgi:hypothetical protein